MQVKLVNHVAYAGARQNKHVDKTAYADASLSVQNKLEPPASAGEVGCQPFGT